MDKNTMIKVTNRNNGTTGYIIPEMNNLQRQFAPGVTKEVSFEELQQLYWLKGGKVLLEEYLIIEDPEAVKALQMEVEPEYFYTDKQIIDIMQNGTLEQFLDLLDFANASVLESVKILAVDLPLNDVAKRQAILDKLGFNVDQAIMVQNSKYDGDAEEIAGTKINKKRRTAAPINPVKTSEPKEPTRRYKVVVDE